MVYRFHRVVRREDLVSSFETIRYEVEDGLARITLARPEKRNAVSHAMFTELGHATEQAATDPHARAVLVAGEGPSFCAGIDLSLLGELGSLAARATEDEGGFRAFVHMAQQPFRTLARMSKPTVAAVQGHAVGAGLQLALACDLRVAGADAMFGMLEPRYGLIPDLGGAHRLARLVGPSRAKELVWSTRVVDAQEALSIGLVDRLVGSEALLVEATALARQVSQHSPTAVALIKELIEGASETALDREFELEAEAQARAIRTDRGSPARGSLP
jgi:enoyl-CoA hydratase